MPDEYRRNCVYTRPGVQQPDFEKSNCNEECLLEGMNVWLAGALRGDASWRSFLKEVPSSCVFKNISQKGKFLLEGAVKLD